jgi:hypothetical protein
MTAEVFEDKAARKMMDQDEWLQNILSVVQNFADAEYQERVWIRGEGPEVDSLVEAYCGIFDDYDLEGFIFHCVQNSWLSGDQLNCLRLLRDALNEFRFDDQQPDKIAIGDPAWTIVRELAASTLEKFTQP